MNVEVIWQIAGIGILIAVIHGVFKTAGREELAWLTTLAGVTVILWLVVRIINDLFQSVRAMFQL